jgi:hypothetical protein
LPGSRSRRSNGRARRGRHSAPSARDPRRNLRRARDRPRARGALSPPAGFCRCWRLRACRARRRARGRFELGSCFPYVVILGATILLAWDLLSGDTRARELRAAAWPLAGFVGWTGCRSPGART